MKKIKIETTCGKTFEQAPSEMSDFQLDGLLEQNADRTDLDPGDADDIAAMRKEQQARRRPQPA